VSSRAVNWPYAGRVLRHVNLLTWNDGTDQAAIDALCQYLTSYAETVPEIRGVSFGPDLGLAERNMDFAIIVDFDDEDAFSRYLAHPAHARLVSEFLRPILHARQAIQFNFSPIG
jgi:stress responsive alpha/beta barrel protein